MSCFHHPATGVGEGLGKGWSSGAGGPEMGPQGALRFCLPMLALLPFVSFPFPLSAPTSPAPGFLGAEVKSPFRLLLPFPRSL